MIFADDEMFLCAEYQVFAFFTVKLVFLQRVDTMSGSLQCFSLPWEGSRHEKNTR